MTFSKKVSVTSLIKTGKLYIGDGYRAKNSELANRGYPFLRIRNLNNGFHFEGADCIPYSEFKKVKNKKSIIGDVAFTSKGTIGRFGFVKKDTVEFVYSPQICFWRSLDQKIIHSEYLYYWMNSPSFLEQVTKVSGQTDMALFVSLRDQRKMFIDLPPIHKQKQIASILSNYDQLIENNNRRIAILEEMAEEIYKEWFVRLRFPNWRETKVVDGIPKGWEVKQLGEVIEFYIGGGWGKDEMDSNFSETAYVIRGTDIPHFKKGTLNKSVYRFHKKSNLASRKLNNGDIVFEVSGGTETQWLGRTVLINQDVLDRFGDKVMCASFCKLIRPNEKVNSLFLYYFFNRIYSTAEVSLFQVQSTGISNFQFEDFLKYQKILIPNEKILNLFEELTIPIQKEVQLLGAKNENLQKTRDLLLPRLVSGKLNVEHLLN